MAQPKNGRVTPRRKAEPEIEVGLDPGKLTIGDLIDLEEHFGLSLDQLMAMAQGVTIAKMSAKTLAALVFAAKRQSDPDFRPEDARGVSMEEFIGMMGGDAPKELKQARQRLAGTGGPPAPAGPTQGD